MDELNQPFLMGTTSKIRNPDLLLSAKESQTNKPLFIPLPNNEHVKRDLLLTINELVIEALQDDSVDTVNIEFYKIRT